MKDSAIGACAFLQTYHAALDAPDPEMRLLALDVASVSAASAALPSELEYSIVLRYAALNHKAAASDTRYRASRLLASFMQRVSAGLALSRRRWMDAQVRVRVACESEDGKKVTPPPPSNTHVACRRLTRSVLLLMPMKHHHLRLQLQSVGLWLRVMLPWIFLMP
jgi:hypothetical protein